MTLDEAGAETSLGQWSALGLGTTKPADAGGLADFEITEPRPSRT
eukprot:gene48612-65200_t